MSTPESQAFIGTWQLLRAESEGEQAPEMFVAKTEVVFTATTYAVLFGGGVSDRGSFALNPSTSPKTITLHGEKGPNAGRSIPGIYQLMGDRLRVCYGFAGVVPADFTSGPGDRRYVALYRRKTT